jgi:hypothetical protein
MPARADEGSNGNKRRTDRVLVALPIELTASDPNGIRFTEPCFTEMVSLHGASVALLKRASAEHPVTLHRRALDLHVQARILGQLGYSARHVYGICVYRGRPEFLGYQLPATRTGR